jgi:hypothetical protein
LWRRYILTKKIIDERLVEFLIKEKPLEDNRMFAEKISLFGSYSLNDKEELLMGIRLGMDVW